MTKKEKIITGVVVGLLLAAGIGWAIYANVKKKPVDGGDDGTSGGGGGGGGNGSGGGSGRQMSNYIPPVETNGIIKSPPPKITNLQPSPVIKTSAPSPIVKPTALITSPPPTTTTRR